MLTAECKEEEAKIPCTSMHGEKFEELNHDIEEADVRIIPHILYTIKAERIVILSNDTDVLVLVLHYTDKFLRKGVKEIWMHRGAGNKVRYIPVHRVARIFGKDTCRVLVAGTSPSMLL